MDFAKSPCRSWNRIELGCCHANRLLDFVDHIMWLPTSLVYYESIQFSLCCLLSQRNVGHCYWNCHEFVSTEWKNCPISRFHIISSHCGNVLAFNYMNPFFCFSLLDIAWGWEPVLVWQDISFLEPLCLSCYHPIIFVIDDENIMKK